MSNDHYRKEENSRRKRTRINIWVAIGAIFLIVLLILWLTFADLTGNTDVAAFISPALMPGSSLPALF
ncbi:MAG: hypothetical protein K2M06_08375 [Muribaculaceae bacterium]|nr:hypothetical protein [Muribaculaceae bacterium]